MSRLSPEAFADVLERANRYAVGPLAKRLDALEHVHT